MVRKKSKFKRVCLYCSEKNKSTGNGMLGRTINIEGLTKEQVKKIIDKMKLDQRTKNKEFMRKFKIQKKQQLLLGDETQQVLEASQDPLLKKENIPEIEKEKDITKEVNEERKIPKGIKVIDKLNLKFSNGGDSTGLFGSSKRGKSTLMMHIFKKYYNKKKFISTLFSINSQIPLYKKTKSLIKINNFGHEAQRYIKDEQRSNKRCKNKYNWVNLIDDVINTRNNNLINNLILTFRNSKISTVICQQYVVNLAKQSRSSLNNALFFGMNTDESIETVIKTFLKSSFNKLGIRGLDNQIEFYKQMTFDHAFLYLHPESNTLTFHKLSMTTLNGKK